MRTYECPQRDFELRANDDDTLSSEQKFCPTHYVPLVQNEHEAGHCQEVYDVVNGAPQWRCSNTKGVKAYETTGGA